MTDGPPQGSFDTIIDERTTIPYWELSSWWHQPEQSTFWPMPDDSPDEQQRRASYFPKIPINYPEINEPGPISPFPFEFPQLPCPDPNATTIEVPTEQPTNPNAPGTPEPEKTVPDPIDKCGYAYTAERHPDGRFKKRRQPSGTTVPDLATEPSQSAQPTRDLSNGPTSPNSNTSGPRGIRPKSRNRVRTSRIGSPLGGQSITGSTEPCEVLIRNPKCNPPWGKKRKTINPAPGMTSRRVGEGSPPPTFTVEGYNPRGYDTFYCSRCRTDNSSHSYRECPLWRECRFCDRIGHWGFDCPIPHTKCSRHRCGVHVGHPRIGKACPWSKERKNENFRYGANGLERDLTRAREVYGVGLDWDSYGLPVWLTRAEGPQWPIEELTSYDV
jgi:hypothetical protein